ncbi:MAG: hypothetical protein OEN01_05655 [Candidatus Krumholzibacteria bacterium]|nr:hypothetical protein [Candidatus Krumholzibacteria bacterium]
MLRRPIVTLWIVASLCASPLLVGCGDDGTGPPPPPPPPPPSLVEQGWEAFENGDFFVAANKFQQAITDDPANAEARDGFGWSSLKLGNLQDAQTSFDEALVNGFAGADPHVGRAIVLRDISPPDFTAAIDAAGAALAIDSVYQFAHDTELDWRDVRLVLAQSHFALSAYDQANAQVGLLGGNMQNPASTTFVADLLAEIERLGVLFGG